MSKPVLHQFIIGATPGDAITDHAFLLRRWLREDGFRSEIFAESIAPTLQDEVRPYLDYRPSRDGQVVILHHSIGSNLVDHLLSLNVEFVIVYHNVTPPEFFQGIDPVLTEQLSRGRAQLTCLRDRTLLGLADSPYNEADLQNIGFGSTGVLPITLDESKYQLDSNPKLLASYQKKPGPFMLFVGRLVPSKRQEDLIKQLYYLRRVEPNAHLFLVGTPWVPSYVDWLRELAQELDVENAITFAGHVSQRDLITYYRLADLYVSMSEHEGFGKPLIESMYFDIPVVAYRAAAVPGTLEKVGVLFKYKNYEALAELLSILAQDKVLKNHIIAHQRERVQQFFEPCIREIWRKQVSRLLSIDIASF